MSAFLRPAGESGEGVLDFFHRQLAKAVRRRYLSDDEGKLHEISIHKTLAEYFMSQADPLKDGSWNSNNRRGVSELPYHLLKAHSWDALSQVNYQPT
jgi:hypothetical protein